MGNPALALLHAATSPAALSCVPVIFGPHIKPYCPAPSWWTGQHIAVVAAVVLGALLTAAAVFRRRRRDRDSMSPGEIAIWRTPRTVKGLGQYAAMWLEGLIGSQPGYAPHCGPDEETLPLVPVLARLNRAGFVTDGSQPGESAYFGDDLWQQRAAVQGFADADLAQRLQHAAIDAGLECILHDPADLPRRRYHDDLAVAVTRTDGGDPDCPTRLDGWCAETWFGTQVPRRHIRSRRIGYGICHRDAVNALCSAWQLTIIDPEWGRDPSPLWDVLDAATRSAPRMIP